MDFTTELFVFMRVRKMDRLLPVIVTMAVFGRAAVPSQGSAVVPFIYAVF